MRTYVQDQVYVWNKVRLSSKFIMQLRLTVQAWVMIMGLEVIQRTDDSVWKDADDKNIQCKMQMMSS